MNSQHLKQASIPFFAVLAIWWWSGDDDPIHDPSNPQEQAAQGTETAKPRHNRLPDRYAEDRQAAWMGSHNRGYDHRRAQGPTQQFWAPEQTHLGPYRFRPLSEREKHRLYSAAPAYAEPVLHDFQPGSYARALPDPARQVPGYQGPRWHDPAAGGNYSYRPADPNRAQSRRWRSGYDPAARWNSPYQQGPEPWSSRDYRWTAEYPSWQSPAERMLPAAEIGLDPTLSSLY